VTVLVRAPSEHDRIAATLRGDADVWPADTDWNEVLAVAERHGVAVLLANAVPNDVLRAAARRSTERAFQLARQLRVLVEALTASGIEVLPIKGPVLAVSAYGDPARRGVSGDLDLVVRRRDFERALACLLALGYTRHEGSSDAEHEHEQWESEAHLLPPALPGTMVELHTELIGNFHTAPVNLDAVFSRARTQTLFGVPMRVPAAEDLLLYLCLHGARHLWSRLLWVCDVDAVIRGEPSLDWETLLARAAAIDATRRLILGVQLAHQLLRTPLPPLVGGPTRAHRRTLTLVARRMADTSAGRRIPSLRLRLASELAARETLSQRLTYLRKQLTPTPRDRAWLRVPRRLEWLHLVLRPLRLLTRYGHDYEKRK
jgi:hypothetical protein